MQWACRQIKFYFLISGLSFKRCKQLDRLQVLLRTGTSETSESLPTSKVMLYTIKLTGV